MKSQHKTQQKHGFIFSPYYSKFRFMVYLTILKRKCNQINFDVTVSTWDITAVQSEVFQV